MPKKPWTPEELEILQKETEKRILEKFCKCGNGHFIPHYTYPRKYVVCCICGFTKPISPNKYKP